MSNPDQEFTLMFHGINELRNKAYPPNRPDALEAARRKRLADEARRGTVSGAADGGADAKDSRTIEEANDSPGDGTLAA